MLQALLKISEIYARVTLVSLNYAPCIKIMLLDFKQNKGKALEYTQNKQQLITYLVTAAHHFNKPIIKQCAVTRFPCICSSELLNILLIIFQSMEPLRSK